MDDQEFTQDDWIAVLNRRMELPLIEGFLAFDYEEDDE